MSTTPEQSRTSDRPTYGLKRDSLPAVSSRPRGSSAKRNRAAAAATTDRWSDVIDKRNRFDAAPIPRPQVAVLPSYPHHGRPAGHVKSEIRNRTDNAGADSGFLTMRNRAIARQPARGIINLDDDVDADDETMTAANPTSECPSFFVSTGTLTFIDAAVMLQVGQTRKVRGFDRSKRGDGERGVGGVFKFPQRCVTPSR
ncbi:hypothetical protein HN011_002416 [Eciton burchellii]|jgi:hypothetical protein|nr:hypothetical protein HN011_002416 [Eciton burchellii]